MEEWKEVNGYEGFYEVSSEGKVKSVPRLVNTTMNARHYVSVLLTPSLNDSGYYVVNLSKNGIVNTHKIHRLVAKAFIENPDNKPCVDHINGIRNDNRVENLRWCTKLENNTFDLANKNRKESHKNQTNANLRKKIYQYTLEGELVNEFDSAKEAAEAVDCVRASITKACRENITIKGFKWSYIKKEDDI